MHQDVAEALASRCLGLRRFQRSAFHIAVVLAIAAGVLPRTAIARETATSISTKAHHTCAITSTGRIKCWGSNSAGQLGDGTTTTRLTPVLVQALPGKAIAVAAGRQHTCALTRAGAVLCWGDNAFGQLGDGSRVNRASPATVSGLASGVAAIAAGSDHTCALMASGALTCWGYNADGELGDGTTKRRLMPVDVNGFTSGGIAVAAGAHHTCALTTDGGVRCWGLNDGSQIGDGTTMSRLTPVDVFATLSRNSVSAGEVACTQARYHRSAKTAFYRYRNVCHYPVSTYVCAGTYDPFVETDPCRFEGDYRFHLRLDVDQTFDIEVPLPGGGLVEFNDMKECPKNRVIAGGTVNTFPCRHADPLMDVGAVTAGLDHTCVLTKSAGIKCWGANDFGQLGDGSKTTRPIAVDVAGLTAVAAVAAGENHTCAVTTAGGTLCWGSNSSGRLGDGSTKDRRTPIGVVGLGSGVEDVATGAISCALTVAGGVKCWGANANGELGNGSTKERHTPVAVRGF